jgi:hypothetical protein
MPDVVAKVTCGSCGKSFTWKPQYAGRTLKCVCGTMIKAPTAAPAPAPGPAAPDASSADEFERAFSGGGYAVDEPAASAPKRQSSPAGLQAAVAAVGSPKQRRYDVDYSGGDIDSTVRHLRLWMSAIALVLMIGGWLTFKAIIRFTKVADPPMRIVTFENGQRTVIEEAKPAATPRAGAGGASTSSRKRASDGIPVLVPPTADSETPQQKALRLARERAASEDVEIAAIIKDENLSEARAWLNPDFNNHAGFRMQNTSILSWANQFYDAGAKMVWIRTVKDGRNDMATEWIVQMPDDPAARSQVLRKRTQLHHDISLTDLGNKYLRFPIDIGGF